MPWFCLVALAYAALLLWRRPTAAAVRRARLLAGVVMLAAAVGIALHVNENYIAGPLDQRYERLWEGMSEVERWGSAFSKAVGPAPTFAPASLALVALILIVATPAAPGASRLTLAWIASRCARALALVAYRSATPAAGPSLALRPSTARSIMSCDG